MSYIQIVSLLFYTLIFGGLATYGQKKGIDSNACVQWRSLELAQISPDGQYVWYPVANDYRGTRDLVVRSIPQKWERTFSNINGQPTFVAGSKEQYLVFINQHDSLLIWSLGKNRISYVPQVFAVSTPGKSMRDWIVYQPKNEDHLMILQNLTTGKKQVYQGVIGYLFSQDGQSLILQTAHKKGRNSSQVLSWINWKQGDSTRIWEGDEASHLTLDGEHEQLAFMSGGTIWHFNKGTGKAVALVEQETGKLDPGLKLSGIKRFSKDGTRLFITLQEEERVSPKKEGVEIWSYTDKELQPAQLQGLRARTYDALVRLSDHRVIRLQQPGGWFPRIETDDIIFINHRETIGTWDMNWNIAGQGTDSVLFTSDGKKLPFFQTVLGLSPQGKYAIIKVPGKKGFFSYQMTTGVIRHMSTGIPDSLDAADWESERWTSGGQIAGWLEKEEAVLIYDKHDVWKMSLSREESPINVTGGFGRKHHIVLTLVTGEALVPTYGKKGEVIMSAFNPETKETGFFTGRLDQTGLVEKLCMGPYIYAIASGNKPSGAYMPSIIKAKEAEVYLLARQSATQAPNYFTTRDFKTFTPVSDNHPEKDYNWYSSELHNWTSLDGRKLQGILYKPEDFDPKKKYPLLIHYYERKSDGLNAYIVPDLYEGANIDIPTYVSNGYLVFTPDIYYKIGEPMQGAYDAVISAANYLSAMPYVDNKKMGIQGHSFGGFETNYLITHSNLFAAACSASGIANLISGYGFINESGNGNHGFYEAGQIRLGVSLWESPGGYFKNSPIFNLDKVTTPVLMMHTKNDGICPYAGAVEMFTGLRRLGKKAWMLVYEGDHSISGKDALDYNTRMMQFFDHYLKDIPAPVWMTRGIPASRKGLDNGYEYDKVTSTPGPGLLIPEQQRIVDSLMTRKPFTISWQ